MGCRSNVLSGTPTVFSLTRSRAKCRAGQKAWHCLNASLASQVIGIMYSQPQASATIEIALIHRGKIQCIPDAGCAGFSYPGVGSLIA